MTTTHDWPKHAQRARAQLIMAASEGRTVPYSQLSKSSHLGWFSKRILWPVHEECKQRGEPDLTALLVRKGEPPEDPELIQACFDYWAEPLP